MCGRFGEARMENLQELFGATLKDSSGTPQRFNVCPKQSILVLKQDKTGNRTLEQLQWWFTPSWAKDQKMTMINAKSETIFEKPSFRSAIKSRRCIVPAGWFYEWKKEGCTKQPYSISIKNANVIPMAGIWETWHNPETDADIDTVSILTTSSNEQVSSLHDRMPVILQQDDFDLWLGDAPKEDIAPLLVPFAGEMEIYPVSTFVNKVGNEGSACAERLNSL